MSVLRYKNPHENYQRAKNLRRQGSLSERLLWNQLLVLKKSGIKFRRQHPLHPYIADFACTKNRLIIELDGQSHDARMKYDAKREAVLKSRGWTIIRFNNDEVLTNLENVVLVILEEIGKSSKEGPPPRSYGEDTKT